MKIIEKIEIKYFRSFSDKKVEITDLRDINIFSGANDSGKSNILRGLNLFFNNEVAPGLLFDSDKDLSKIHWERSNLQAKEKRDKGMKDVRQKDLFVDIKVHFRLPSDFGGMLPRQFFVSRQWTQSKHNPPHQRSNVEIRYKKEKGDLSSNQKNALQGQLTQFLNKIEFKYVPAIKDRSFFKHLYRELQGRLLEREMSEISNKSKDLQNVIRKETTDLFEEFKKSTGLDASFFLLEENLVDFSKSVEVETFRNIHLPNRGDGIQARFIPDVLNEITKKSRKKFNIWGFEEPENSYELKNIRKLRDNFINIYSKEKQIFITTHSREFLAIHDLEKSTRGKKSKISIYRIYKKADDSSQVARYEEHAGFNKEQIQTSFWSSENETPEKKTILDELFDDLGIIDESRKIVELEDMFKKGDERNRELQKIINDLKKPIVFVEDENLNLYKIAWLKLNGVGMTSTDFSEKFNEKAPFKICSSGGKEELYKKLNMVKTEEFNNKKIIGIFDFDDAYEKFNGLKHKRWNAIEGEVETCLFKKRMDTNKVYAILIPVPKHRTTYASKGQSKNFLIIEHLFEDNILRSSKHLAAEKQNVGAGGNIIKITGKNILWIDALSFKRTAFKHFKPLFERIYYLFGL